VQRLRRRPDAPWAVAVDAQHRRADEIVLQAQ